MLNKLSAFMEEYSMVQTGDTVTCAVSGGADSVALLFALYLLKDKLGIYLQAAHFNHGLRGEESREEEAFVREFCQGYGIPLFIGAAEVVPGEKGLEAAARDARYGFFDTLKGKIATAHTADDNAETVLMRMVRGTGLKGLGGISPVRGKLIRPMLGITRQEVLAFLEEYSLPHREDSSNATDAFLRNRLRHHVMPLLKQENPSLAENMSAMALRLRRDEEALSTPVDFSQGLSLEEWQLLPRAKRSRVAAAFLEHCGVREPEAEHISLLEALAISQKPSARAYFPGGITVERCYGVLRKAQRAQACQQISLAVPGVTRVGTWEVECVPAQEIVNTEDTFTVNTAGQLILRSRETGDAMRLSGGTKSLKKLFVDRKIPAAQRQEIPVLADDAGVLGVYGIGVNRDRAAQELPATRIQIRSRKER